MCDGVGFVGWILLFLLVLLFRFGYLTLLSCRRLIPLFMFVTVILPLSVAVLLSFRSLGFPPFGLAKLPTQFVHLWAWFIDVGFLGWAFGFRIDDMIPQHVLSFWSFRRDSSCKDTTSVWFGLVFAVFSSCLFM